jgi:glycerophosphoryl diester phosphodiesterase
MRPGPFARTSHGHEMLAWLETLMRFSSALIVTMTALSTLPSAQPARKLSVAHRGASAYAPEHTFASYRLAIEQRADLERTTDVEQVFPGRSTEAVIEGRKRQVWLANDFTLAEIKQLDAGSWFDPKFAGERVPTFDEVVELVKGRAGLYPELKTPEMYEGRDVRFEELVAAALDKHGLRGKAADRMTPLILQTFGEASARKLAGMKIGVPVVLLIANGAGWDGARIATWKGVVQGFGPAKGIVLKNPQFVTLAHAAGIAVTPYTFRSADSGAFPSVKAEMEHYLYTLGVDALFTDNPDQFPRR